MFDAPGYASYIALCRELQLEHRFEAGDWWVTVHDTPIAWRLPGHEPVYISDPNLCNDDGGNFPGYQDEHQSYVWLPRLDQWMAMLGEAGCPDIGMWAGDGYAKCGVLIPGASVYDGIAFADLETAPFREEAAARLWCAVTGRKVTA
jgi:hypothetical protein